MPYNAEAQYLDLMDSIIDHGKPMYNERTGKVVLTRINADLVYVPDEFPLITTRKAYWKAAIAEMLGYLRGYNNAADFRALGTRTWDANANENKVWLDNPHRKGKDDMGLAYRFRNLGYHVELDGVQSPDKPNNTEYVEVDQLRVIYDKLRAGVDDRGLIMTAWHPHLEKFSCLRPCMHSYQFSLVYDTLYLNVTQRSSDVPLGAVFNMVQAWFFLFIMARITGHKQGNVYHKIVNAHIYEDQVLSCTTQLKRIPFNPPKLVLDNPNINTLDDVLTILTPDDFRLVDYRCHDSISFPFAV